MLQSNAKSLSRNNHNSYESITSDEKETVTGGKMIVYNKDSTFRFLFHVKNSLNSGCLLKMHRILYISIERIIRKSSDICYSVNLLSLTDSCICIYLNYKNILLCMMTNFICPQGILEQTFMSFYKKTETQISNIHSKK